MAGVRVPRAPGSHICSVIQGRRGVGGPPKWCLLWSAEPRDSKFEVNGLYNMGAMTPTRVLCVKP